MLKTASLAALLALAATAATAAPAYKVEIDRTKYGIPHVLAADYGSVGYGQAYAFAQDNLCLLADKIVTVNGERSKYMGPSAATTVAFAETPNLEADFFFRFYIDLPALQANFAAASPEYRALVTGYVAGYNRFLKDTPPEKRPAACREAAWVRPITVDDMLRLNEERMIQASGGNMLRAVNAAAPPGDPAPKPAAMNDDNGFASLETPTGLGSNGWAFGRDVTRNKSGVLLGNPHFPWETTNRFYELHLTIPGKLDVMGVTIAGAPGMSIGFNKDVAWTHTVSTDRHFTLFELQLDATDPTTYLIDGQRFPMERRVVSVDVGKAEPVTRVFYSTSYGPVVALPQAGLTWSPKAAFALKDADKGNVRSGDTWLDIARARSVGQIRSTIETRLGIPWVNTIAADRHGDALYADITATPNVSAEKLAACAPPSGIGPAAAANRVYILDGSRSSCDWDVAPGVVQPGLMPGASMPAIIRQDYVANSNDSYWLANAKAPIAALSPIVGPGATAQNLRTRAGIREIEARIAGTDGLPGRQIDPAAVKTILYRNKNLAAELTLDDLLKHCLQSADLQAACAILAKWDRRMNEDSVGALLFVEFWRRAERIPGLWAKPFDPADPVNTPSGLNTAGDTGPKLLQALSAAVQEMKARGLALDAPYGRVHFAVRGEQHIPIHGGEGGDGVLNAQQSRYVPGVGGYVPFHGSSYIQVVTFDAKGPVADAVLTYSQATDPASPHYADQTLLHSKKGWNRLPFHRADILADPTLTVLKLEE